MTALLAPSPERAIPRCPHYGVCGGCNLLHVSYETQLCEKAKQLTFLLERKSVKLPREIVVLPSKQRHSYRWRSRIALSFLDGKVTAGFRKFHSNEVVAVHSCLIVAPEIVSFIQLLNRQKAVDLGALTVECSVVVDLKQRLRLLVVLDDVAKAHRAAVRAFFEQLPCQEAAIAAIFFEENGKRDPAVIDYGMYVSAGFTFSYLPWTFIQGNIPTDEVLIETVLSFVQGQRLLDLYCGIGNLALPVARRCATVLGVEGDPASVALADMNARNNKVENASFVCLPVERFFSETRERFDTILLDPPRTGCTPPVIEGLLSSGAQRIVYVSCNPVTLATDLAALCASYRLVDIVAIDLFPDINHVETVAVPDRLS